MTGDTADRGPALRSSLAAALDLNSTVCSEHASRTHPWRGARGQTGFQNEGEVNIFFRVQRSQALLSTQDGVRVRCLTKPSQPERHWSANYEKNIYRQSFFQVIPQGTHVRLVLLQIFRDKFCSLKKQSEIHRTNEARPTQGAAAKTKQTTYFSEPCNHPCVFRSETKVQTP